MKSHLTANTTSVLSVQERIKSSVEMQWERRKKETEESEPHRKPQNKSDGWRREGNAVGGMKVVWDKLD